MTTRERPRRALLFMPGDDDHKIAKGAMLNVDSIIMDLEDGVAPGRKEAARENIRRILVEDEIDFGWTERLVRVNTEASGLQETDVAVTMEGRPDGYVLPKVESALDVERVSQQILEKEHELGVEPEQAVFVGDPLHDDVKGAQAAGMKGVWGKPPRSVPHGRRQKVSARTPQAGGPRVACGRGDYKALAEEEKVNIYSRT